MKNIHENIKQGMMRQHGSRENPFLTFGELEKEEAPILFIIDAHLYDPSYTKRMFSPVLDMAMETNVRVKNRINDLSLP